MCRNRAATRVNLLKRWERRQDKNTAICGSFAISRKPQQPIALPSHGRGRWFEPSEFKNHDIYQMLAYCTATRVQRGLLIYPVHAAVVQDLVVIRNTGTVIRPATVGLSKESIEELNQERETFAQTVLNGLHAQTA
jgi:hypothetical protein